MEQLDLDYNATTPTKPEVVQIISEALQEVGNPSSVHSFGRRSRELIEQSRDSLAEMVGANSTDIIFTSGGTESNNMALSASGRRRIIISAIEHPSIMVAAEKLYSEVVLLPVNNNGLVTHDILLKAIGADGSDALISVMLANNETGVIQPIKELAAIAHNTGAIFHCDAVQGPGRIPINMNALGVDMLSISGHKFGGPKGVGAIILSPKLHVKPLIIGGGQERGWRGGTENVPGIVGMGLAARLAISDLKRSRELKNLRNYLENKIREICNEVVIYSSEVERLPNTSSITMPGVQSETQVMTFDLAGIAVSAGSACSSGKVEASHVLKAMGSDESISGCAIRVSLGWDTSPEDIERFIGVWRATLAGLSSRFI